MRCLFCGCEESKVIDSRSTEEGNSIRRRRECLRCKKRFTTYEKIETIPIVVVKKDLSRQQFEREKIINGLRRACEKRPVSTEIIEKIADEIESSVYNSLEREISSEKIGEMLIDRLKGLDDVAYVRFASVYRQFKDLKTFRDELNKLMNIK